MAHWEEGECKTVTDGRLAAARTREPGQPMNDEQDASKPDASSDNREGIPGFGRATKKPIPRSKDAVEKREDEHPAADMQVSPRFRGGPKLTFAHGDAQRPRSAAARRAKRGGSVGWSALLGITGPQWASRLS